MDHELMDGEENKTLKPFTYSGKPGCCLASHVWRRRFCLAPSVTCRLRVTCRLTRSRSMFRAGQRLRGRTKPRVIAGDYHVAGRCGGFSGCYQPLAPIDDSEIPETPKDFLGANAFRQMRAKEHSSAHTELRGQTSRTRGQTSRQ